MMNLLSCRHLKFGNGKSCRKRVGKTRKNQRHNEKETIPDFYRKSL